MDEERAQELLVEITASIASGVDSIQQGVLVGVIFGLEVSESAPELATVLRSVVPTDPARRAINDQLGARIRDILAGMDGP